MLQMVAMSRPIKMTPSGMVLIFIRKRTPFRRKDRTANLSACCHG